MKNRLTWAIILVIVIVGLILLRPKDKNAVIKGPSPSTRIVPVDGMIIKTTPASNIIKISGNIMSNEEVNLQSQIAGIVTEVHFEEGSHVQKGNLLVKIDDSQYQAQLQKDEVSEKLYEITEERQKKLLAINAISQQDYDIAKNNLESIKADMKLIQVNIGYCNIRAPFDGIIGLKNISPGSYITPATVIADIEEISPVKIDFFVPERYADAIKNGDSIRFTVAGSDRTFPGTIYAIDPKVDPTSGSIHIRALSPNKDGKLLAGQFANITIILSHVSNAIMVPTEAIIPKSIGQNIYVSKGGKAVSVPIELGVRTDSTVEVTKGLNPGDTIITRGTLVIYPGTRVKFNILR